MNLAKRPWPRISLHLSAIVALSGVWTLTCLTSVWPQGVATDCDQVDAANHDGGYDQCDAVCAVLKPRWLARGSAVYMDRLTADSLTLIQSTVNPSEQLNADDFNFDWVAGFDLSLTRKAWDDNAVEVRYLGFNSFDASAFAATGGNPVQIDSTPPVFASNVQSIDAHDSSDLFSIEANYQLAIYDSVTVSAGIRYLSFDDDLTSVLDANPQTFGYDVSTRNDLYGVQIGATSIPCAPVFGCLWVSATGKAGIYGNDARQRSLLDTGAASLSINDSADNTAFVGEIGLSSRLPVGQCLSMIAGYSLLYLDNVAIASDQTSASDFFNGAGSDNDGYAVFHGIHLAIELRL